MSQQDDRSREEHLEALTEDDSVSEEVRTMAEHALEHLRERDRDADPDQDDEDEEGEST